MRLVSREDRSDGEGFAEISVDCEVWRFEFVALCDPGLEGGPSSEEVAAGNERFWGINEGTEGLRSLRISPSAVLVGVRLLGGRTATATFM